jgi:hypothetical protein
MTELALMQLWPTDDGWMLCLTFSLEKWFVQSVVLADCPGTRFCPP